MPKPGPYKTQVGATGQTVWFAYVTPTIMLRDSRGIGRRFKSEKAAKKAIAVYHNLGLSRVV